MAELGTHPWGMAIARAGALNRAARKATDRQLTLAAENAPIRFTYGRDRIGGLVVNLLAYGSNIVVQVLWGMALDSIESVTFNDAELPTGASATHYTGSQTTADATLVAAFAAQSPSITYADTLEGYAYSVFSIPRTSFAGGLGFSAIVKGRQVYDPREVAHDPDDASTWEYSDNPALCLADFLTSTGYGAGLSVDWTSVETAADACDALSGSEKTRLIGLTIDAVQPVGQVVEALRTYAGCFAVRRGGTIHLVPDAARSSDATYSHADGDIASVDSLERRDIGDTPTITEVIYTNTEQTPWRDRSAFSPAVGGETVRRLSTVRLPGVQRYSQAYREAVERQNKLTTADLSCVLTVFDRGIQHEPGDVVTITLPFAGVSSKLMRVAEVQHAGPGQWRLTLQEYDPAAYSTEVRTAPTYGDTTLDNPNEPDSPAGISVAEEVYQLDNGTYASRARVTITEPSFQWIAGYRVEVVQAGQIIDTGTTPTTEYATPALQEGVTYTVRASTLSTSGAVSEATSTSITVAGKSLPPGDVPSVSGFEVGGDVYLSWSAAVDLDIWRYEIRYGATGGSWETATLVDRVDGLRAVIRGAIPAGEWKFWLKAIDSVGQYSTNATSVTLTVTVDPDALQTSASFSSPTLTAMKTFQRERGGATLWVTAPDAAGDQVGTLFPNPMGTYGNVLADYHTSATSTWQSEVYDFGQELTGDWDVDAVYSMLSGTATVTLQLASATAYPTFTDYTSLPTKQTARYAKVKIEATTTETLLVESVGVTVAAVTRKEFGTKTCAATGTDTVTLDGEYSARRRIVVTPIETTSARMATVDNITFGSPSSFDIYLFDAAGNRVAGDVAWAFEGI